jgi:hypothetical protein
MNRSTLFIIIASIIFLILLIIGVSLLYYTINEGYGKYLFAEITPCSSLNCDIEGHYSSISYCEKNPITNRGCLINGNQTFAPLISKHKCKPTCIKYAFREINRSPCVTVKNEEQQTITYECTKIGKKGLNNCITQDVKNGISGVTVHDEGYKMDLVIPCL